MVNRDMVWKLSKLQSDYNELHFDVGMVLTVHKSFVSHLLTLYLNNTVERLNPNAAIG